MPKPPGADEIGEKLVGDRTNRTNLPQKDKSAAQFIIRLPAALFDKF
jgi:hypothetical protein